MYQGNSILSTFLVLVLLVGVGRTQELWPDKSAEEPEDFFDLSLDELMEVDIRAGEPGWFGTQLEQLTFDPWRESRNQAEPGDGVRVFLLYRCVYR